MCLFGRFRFLAAGNSISSGVLAMMLLPDLVFAGDTTSISGVSPGDLAAGGLVLNGEKCGTVITGVVEAKALFPVATAGVREALADDSKPGLV